VTNAEIKKTVKRVPGSIRFHAAIMRFVSYVQFLGDYLRFRKMAKDGRLSLQWRDRYPCLDERTAVTGFDRHYLYHPAWAARVLADIRPNRHLDISSSLQFCSLVSAFVPVSFFDFRPAEIFLSNLESGQADICALPFADGSIQSLSCMHVVEHVGLGRYGDPLDPDGDLKAMAELKRVLAPGGNLLFVVPVGKPRIQYNAHRIYSYDQVREAFADFDLKEFSLIPDGREDGGLIRNATPEMADRQSYGCGCFWFRRPT
jgi:SAM-dependent methyltransferase